MPRQGVYRVERASARVFLRALAATALLASPSLARAADATWPANVSAKYKLQFGGFDVGSYRFQSASDGKTYTTTASAEVSALFGAFKWKGAIESKGTLDALKPHPANYKLDFKSKKSGSVALGFDSAGVKSVSVLPAKPPHPDAVPIKPEHLKNVFDPMSSILTMTHATGTNPCNRTIPIFDGKVRFNLVMTYKGEQRLKEGRASGQPTQLKVCKVKYIPIAGHKPEDFEKPWVDYSGIEIALRPIPSANTFVPYQVTIPTTLGSAVMLAESVMITASNKTEIALTQ